MSKLLKTAGAVAGLMLGVAPFAAQAAPMRIVLTGADLTSDAAIANRAARIAGSYCSDEGELRLRSRCETEIRAEAIAKLAAVRQARIAAAKARPMVEASAADVVAWQAAVVR